MDGEMGKTTTISWTDHTFNPWWGCTKVSPGCDNCYAETFDRRVFGVELTEILRDGQLIQIGNGHWGKGVPRRTFGDKHWAEPLKWNRDALAKFGRPARVFCASMADVMDDEAPTGARERLWALIDETPNLMWLLLSKRPQRYRRYLPQSFKHSNAQLGFTAENQDFYDSRVEWARQAACQRDLLWWVSYEPALGPLEIGCSWCDTGMLHSPDICNIPAWMIFGGESGHNRRSCELAWAQSMRDQCQKLGTAFFMKQMGGRTPAEGKALIPAELLIQEFPA